MKYMIALKFEGTAMPTRSQRRGGKWFREITAIGANVFDVADSHTLTEFNRFVRPTKFPLLSQRYQRYFGIEQSTIDDQPPLFDVMEEFHDWICVNEEVFGFVVLEEPWMSTLQVMACICTWDSTHLRDIWRKEAEEKGLPYPDYLKHWIDIQKVVKRKYPSLRSYRLLDVAEYLGIKTEGIERTAVNDARLLASIVQRIGPGYITDDDIINLAN